MAEFHFKVLATLLLVQVAICHGRHVDQSRSDGSSPQPMPTTPVYGYPGVKGPAACGVKLESNDRISGGVEVDAYSQPWMVGLIDPLANGIFCGGVLVSDRHVLTAAHCFAAVPGEDVAKVVVGEHAEDDTDDGLYLDVARVNIHSGYDEATRDNDLALLTLKRKVQFDERVNRICLPLKNEDFAGDKAFITGWGIKDDLLTGPKLNGANVTIYSEVECSGTGIGSFVTENMLCAGSKQGSSEGACRGDDGGPLTIKQAGATVLTGILSFGTHDCGANNDIPDVYSKVSAAISWIREKINEANPQCGVKLDSGDRINGGAVVTPYSIPWHVGLHQDSEDIYCGGTLISRRHVLTAAHCVSFLNDATNLFAVLGEHENKFGVIDTDGEVIQASCINIHPSYNAASRNFDLAIVTLKSEASFSERINRACLPHDTNELFANVRMEVSGFGAINGGSAANVLYGANVTGMTNQACQQTPYANRILPEMLCTMSVAGGEGGTCSNDNGGPLTHKDDGIASVVGVVNTPACGASGYPDLFGRVSSAQPWIEEMLLGTCGVTSDYCELWARFELCVENQYIQDTCPSACFST